MHNGLVLHFEDDETWRGIVERNLSGTEHQLVGQAATRAAALEFLDQVHRGEVAANVVITDGNLSDTHTYDDARAITERITELGLPVRVIGLSGDSMRNQGVEVDAELMKADISYGDISKAVDDLPEPESAPEVVEPDLESIFTPAELKSLRDYTVGVVSEPDAWIKRMILEFGVDGLTDPMNKQNLIDFITEQAGFLYQ